MTTLLPCQAEATSDLKSVRDKWAVLIGVDRFQDRSIPALPFAVANVRELAAALKDPQIGRFLPDHLAVLPGKYTTRANIEKVVSLWLMKKALPNDLVIVYISTRLLAAESEDDPLLCAYDSLSTDGKVSCIALPELLTSLKRHIQSKQILVILDTAPLDDSKEPTGDLPDAARLAEKTGVSIISANRPGLPSCASTLGATSIFTNQLIEGLKAGAGLLPLEDVVAYLADSVAAATAQAGCPRQVPDYAFASSSYPLPRLAAGMVTGSWSRAKARAIGHPVDSLAMKRPDLVDRGGSTRKSGSTEAVSRQRDENEGGSGESNNSASLDFGSYMKKMKHDIERRWQPPQGFSNRTVAVVFSIMRDGSIKAPTIVKSSGLEAVDRAALKALEAASPLDPLPLGAPGSVQIRYQFDWAVRRARY